MIIVKAREVSNMWGASLQPEAWFETRKRYRLVDQMTNNEDEIKNARSNSRRKQTALDSPRQRRLWSWLVHMTGPAVASL